MVWVWVGSRVESGWLTKNTGRVMGQPLFASGKKKSSSGRVFFGLGQKILTHFAMSTKISEF